MKKFLIIPILILFYIFLIEIISQINFQPSESIEKPNSSGATMISIGESISITVTRPYLFGLIELPTYVNGLGNIGIYHDMFFIFIVLLTIALIIKEIKNRKEKKVIKRRKR